MGGGCRRRRGTVLTCSMRSCRASSDATSTCMGSGPGGAAGSRRGSSSGWGTNRTRGLGACAGGDSERGAGTGSGRGAERVSIVGTVPSGVLDMSGVEESKWRLGEVGEKRTRGFRRGREEGVRGEGDISMRVMIDVLEAEAGRRSINRRRRPTCLPSCHPPNPPRPRALVMAGHGPSTPGPP